MEIEILLSTMNLKNEEGVKKLVNKMNIKTGVVVINQINKNIKKFDYIDNNIRSYSFYEKGSSISRNRALENANGDILILADDDVKYEDDYEKTIKKAYEKYKDADIIAFYVESLNKKRKIKKQRNHKVNFLTSLKIQSSQITLKKESIENANIKFDEDFGSGCSFKVGEESIFLYEALRKKLKIYFVNRKIGVVTQKQSKWFSGYNKDFFINQGTIFYRLSKKYYKLLILQYALRKRKLYKENLKMLETIKIMFKGAKKYKDYVQEKYGKYNNTNI